jgi:SAM-dependent methyltransferase
MNCQAKESSSSRLKVVIVSNPARRCGVSEFGQSLSRMLTESRQLECSLLEFAENARISDVLSGILEQKPDMIVYNWHPSTMPWLNEEILNAVAENLCCVVQAGVSHDAVPPFRQLCAILHFDPSFEESPREFALLRPIPEFDLADPLKGLVIGSFGFGFENKGFERLVDAVNAEFDEALIRLHVPYNHYFDPDGSTARVIVDKCREKCKNNIHLEVTHEYKTPEEMVRWLSENTLNCFLYDQLEGRGISSTIDFALAARRPIAITQSHMFRHLTQFSDEMVFPRFSLREILSKGLDPVRYFHEKWSPSDQIACFERIVSDLYSRERVLDFRPNRVLTATDRETLAGSIAELAHLSPDITPRKIPEAVFQNAFVFEQAKRMASHRDDIVAIGAYEDPIGPALARLGYKVRLTDPNLDGQTSREVWLESLATGRKYDVVLSCSVMEHVPEDEEFILQLYDILKPGGVAILTTDFKAGWKKGDPKPSPDERLYSIEKLLELHSLLPAGGSSRNPAWTAENPTFEYEGVSYGFCSFCFHKPVEEPKGEVGLQQMLRLELRGVMKEMGLIDRVSLPLLLGRDSRFADPSLPMRSTDYDHPNVEIALNTKIPPFSQSGSRWTLGTQIYQLLEDQKEKISQKDSVVNGLETNLAVAHTKTKNLLANLSHETKERKALHRFKKKLFSDFWLPGEAPRSLRRAVTVARFFRKLGRKFRGLKS